MSSSFSVLIFICSHILCCRPMGSQKHKPLQATVEVWRGAKRCLPAHLVLFLLPSVFVLFFFVLLFVILCVSAGFYIFGCFCWLFFYAASYDL